MGNKESYKLTKEQRREIYDASPGDDDGSFDKWDHLFEDSPQKEAEHEANDREYAYNRKFWE